MKEKVNTILFWVMGLISFSGIVIGVIGDSSRRSETLCPAVSVCIPDSTVNKFVRTADAVMLIDSLYGGYVNVPSESINLSKMEKVLLDVDFVRNATCYVTRDGILHVEISQTTPVAKFLSEEGLFYMSSSGKCMKARTDWNTKIIRLEGSPRISDSGWRKRMGACCMDILGTPTLALRTVKFECRVNGECDLTLDGREEVFFFGKPEQVQAKIGKILEYEKKIAPRPYSVVDVRYKGQIICK